MDYSALNLKKNNTNGALGINEFNNLFSSLSPAVGTDLTYREDEDGTTLGAKGNVGLNFQHRDVNANVNAQFGLPDWAAFPTMMSDPNLSANFLDRAIYQPETENKYLGADIGLNTPNFNFNYHQVPNDIDEWNARYNLGNNSNINVSREPYMGNPAHFLRYNKRF